MWIIRALVVLLALYASASSGALIEIEVTGRVIESHDFGGIFGGASGVGVANDKTATVRFVYDTATAPDDLYSGTNPDVARFESHFGPLACATAQGQYPGGSWVQSSLTLDGISVGGIIGNGSYSNCDYIEQGRFDLGSGLLSYLVVFDEADNSFTTAAESLQEWSRLELQLVAPGDWLGLQPGPLFTIDPIGNFFSVRLFQHAFDLTPDGEAVNERGYDGYLLAIPTFASARFIPVREPSTTTLLIIGLLALLIGLTRTTIQTRN